jgi:hypothetical protein
LDGAARTSEEEGHPGVLDARRCRCDVVIISRQNAALFSDHEQVWADNAESSPFFGDVYVCFAAFRGQEKSPNALPNPITLARSTDGGATWREQQVSPAVDNNVFGHQDCGVRTDSQGIVYVFWQGGDPRTFENTIFLVRSFDGGRTFDRPRGIATFEECGVFDPVGGFTFDGVAGARGGTFPSLDIANSAPTGAGATDRIVVTWCNGPTPTNAAPGPNERALVKWSTNHGDTFSGPVPASPPSDRPDFPAIAISPDGQDVYITYDNFLQPYQTTVLAPSAMQGVMRHADFSACRRRSNTVIGAHPCAFMQRVRPLPARCGASFRQRNLALCCFTIVRLTEFSPQNNP